MNACFCAHGSYNELGSRFKNTSSYSCSEVETILIATTSPQIPRSGSSMVVKKAQMSQLTEGEFQTSMRKLRAMAVYATYVHSYPCF